jgi:hypothetical protein
MAEAGFGLIISVCKKSILMKQRILSGWNFRRVIYLLAGITIVIQSAMVNQWAGVLIGGYFGSMGLFAFGCAAGNCSATNDYKEPKPVNQGIEPVHFEEIK